MFSLFRKQWFFYAYTILIIPSYILPWAGSNSMVANIVSSNARASFALHFFSLALAVGLSFLRGWQIKKSELGFIALTAAFCDLVPLLNLVPFLPSFFHLFTLLVGTNTRISLSPPNLPR